MTKDRKFLTIQVLALVAGVPSAGAGDVLEHIPARAAAVVVVRQPDALNSRLAGFVKRVAEGSAPINEENLRIEKLLNVGLADEWWDHSAPLVFVLTRTSEGETALTVGFKRVSESKFNLLGEPGPDGSRVRRLRGRASQHGFATRIGEYVFLSPQHIVLERILRLPPSESLAAAMTAEQKSLLADNDIYLRARLGPWKQTIDRWTTMLTGFALMARAGGDESEIGAASIDWVVDGFKSCLSQMESMDLAARIQPEGVSITHVHRFQPDGSVAQYLKTVRRRGGDLWAGQADANFVFALGMDGQSARDAQIMLGLTDHVLNCPSVRRKMTPRQCQELRESVSRWYSEMQGMSFVMAPPPGRVMPLEIRGIYRVEDSDAAFDRIKEMQRHNKELVNAFLLGGGLSGDVTESTVNGRRYFEMRLDLSHADPSLHEVMERMYGGSPVCQLAVLGPSRMAYLFSSQEDRLTGFVKEAADRPLSRNPGVRRIMDHLPEQANVVLLLDFGRLLSAALNLAPQTDVLPAHAGDAGAPSALLGWALTASPETLSGRIFVSTNDAGRFVRAVGRFRPPAGPIAATRVAPRPAEPTPAKPPEPAP